MNLYSCLRIRVTARTDEGLVGRGRQSEATARAREPRAPAAPLAGAVPIGVATAVWGAASRPRYIGQTAASTAGSEIGAGWSVNPTAW